MKSEDLLVVGDSLTAGHPGASFARALAGMRSPHAVIAEGRGGDTLLGINQRILPLLRKHLPHTLVVEAGANDLLLPWLEMRGGLWKRQVDRLAAQGAPPLTEVAAFREKYTEIARKLEPYPVNVVVTTIACLGEADTDLERQREQYNEAIRQLAVTCDVRLADVGAAFDGILRAVPSPGTYFLDHYLNLYVDTILSVTSSTTDAISRRRGLALTVDGVHLNTRGANVYARCLLESACFDGAVDLPEVN